MDEHRPQGRKRPATVVERYLSGGRLRVIPARRAHRLAVLAHIAGGFDPTRLYTEREVNAVLSAVYPDYAALRRYLVDYGLLSRNPDGSAYRVEPRPDPPPSEGGQEQDSRSAAAAPGAKT